MLVSDFDFELPEDLIALRDTGIIAGAISGRALYDGAIDLAAALRALKT